MSGMDSLMEELNRTRTSADKGTFLKSSPTSVSTAPAAATSSLPGRRASVYVYVWLFLSLLVLLLTLLLVALHRLKNIITSSPSVVGGSSRAGRSFTHMEICSISSSRRSTVSSLSS
ncbi:serine-rich and transmembrane domain-containing protein 1 [Aplochiton taeniatus]